MGADEMDERDQDEIRKEAPRGDDRGIFQPDDVAEAHDGREPVDAEGHREAVLEPGADLHRMEGDDLAPEAEREHGEVEEERHPGAPDEDLGLGAGALARDEDLGRRHGLREREVPVFLDHEELAERDEEEDAEASAEERGEEDVPEADLHPEHVERGDGEDGPGDDGPRSRPDGLDDDVLEDGAPPGEDAGEPDREDGDRDGGLHPLPRLEGEVGGGQREEDRHGEADADRAGRDFERRRGRRHDRLIGLAGLELAERRRMKLLVLFGHGPASFPFAQG